jgi:very-short-patch-repair endonuclease
MPTTRTKRARHLRRQPTEAEKRLWMALRRKALSGWKFRRQHPVGRYVTDFACPEAGLVVELDGGQHALAVRRDAVRTRAIEASGYRVLRFWNNEVFENMDGVLEAIVAALCERR